MSRKSESANELQRTDTQRYYCTYTVARLETFDRKQFYCNKWMSCDLEVSNESAHCWGKNLAILTILLVKWGHPRASKESMDKIQL